MQTLFASLAAAMLSLASIGAATIDPDPATPVPVALLVLADDSILV